MTDQAQSNEHELRLKLYGETRADLLKRQLSNSENADRAILSVSTAALGFSLAFLKDIVSLQDAIFPLSGGCYRMMVRCGSRLMTTRRIT